MSAVDAGAVLPTVTAGSVLVRWRKLLLRRRQEMTFISQSFEKLWNGHFPHHDFVTLQLKRPAQNKAELYWEGESWKKAARWYHVNRQGRTLLVEFGPSELQRLDRLLSNDISLDAAYRELNAPENRPTPQVTVEAIFHAVRERGLAALKEPATRERLARCDAAALEQIDQRISRLKASV
jgi:hypothetical protein